MEREGTVSPGHEEPGFFVRMTLIAAIHALRFTGLSPLRHWIVRRSGRAAGKQWRERIAAEIPVRKRTLSAGYVALQAAGQGFESGLAENLLVIRFRRVGAESRKT